MTDCSERQTRLEMRRGSSTLKSGSLLTVRTRRRPNTASSSMKSVHASRFTLHILYSANCRREKGPAAVPLILSHLYRTARRDLQQTLPRSSIRMGRVTPYPSETSDELKPMPHESFAPTPTRGQGSGCRPKILGLVPPVNRPEFGSQGTLRANCDPVVGRRVASRSCSNDDNRVRESA